MIYFLVSLLAAVATAIFTVKKNALTVGGAIAAGVLILVAGYFGKWFGLVYLLCAYFTIALIDKIFDKKTKSIFQGINKKAGARDHIQVAANGLSAFICILLYGITDRSVFLLAYAVSLSQAFADSASSDIGVMSKSEPISLCRMKRVQRGLSGGVSLLGTLSGLGASVFCALIYYLFFFDLSGALYIVLFSFIGCLIDSILGDLLQEKFQCVKCGKITEKPAHCDEPTRHYSGIRGLDNCLVNFISNFLSAALTVLCLIW